MVELKPVSTPTSTTTALDPNENGEAVDQREYMSMIGSLLYLIAIRPDIQFDVCLCVLFQASPHSSHRQAVQRIFSYLKYTLEFGIWYSASSSFDLVGLSNAYFAGCGIDRKKNLWYMSFFGSFLVYWSSHK
jgi:hypothetical protein